MIYLQRIISSVTKLKAIHRHSTVDALYILLSKVAQALSLLACIQRCPVSISAGTQVMLTEVVFFFFVSFLSPSKKILR